MTSPSSSASSARIAEQRRFVLDLYEEHYETVLEIQKRLLEELCPIIEKASPNNETRVWAEDFLYDTGMSSTSFENS